MRPRFSVWFEALNSPENFSLFFQALIFILGAVVIWALTTVILSMLGCWFAILVVLALFTIFGVRAHQENRKAERAAAGYCTQCGYDLRGTPERCPECGRDATLDEPAWRRLRRLREAQLKEPNAAIPTPEQNRQRLLSPLPLEPLP